MTDQRYYLSFGAIFDGNYGDVSQADRSTLTAILIPFAETVLCWKRSDIWVSVSDLDILVKNGNDYHDGLPLLVTYKKQGTSNLETSPISVSFRDYGKTHSLGFWNFEDPTYDTVDVWFRDTLIDNEAEYEAEQIAKELDEEEQQ